MTVTLVLALAAPNAGPIPKVQPAGPPTPTQVRAALERAVPYLEKEGVAWLDQRKCIACHHGAWMVWGLEESRRAGVSVNAKKLEALAGRVAEMYLGERAQHETKKTGYVEGTHVLLSGYAAGGKPPQARLAAADLLARGQRPDGAWTYQGQGLDRPGAESDEVTTLWAVLAPDGLEKEKRERALAWLKKAPRGAGNESLALRLVAEQRFGDLDKADTLKKELLARQNSDGGWSWSKGRASDPFATGQSLYALSLVGVKKDSPAVQAGWRFLLGKQRPDGSWFAQTKKPKGGSDISSYWGTTWAVIGLARTVSAE